MGEVIAVLSGKGGTGKTSVCAGVATAMASIGLEVLCVDCDIGLRNLDISLGMSECGALSFLDVAEGSYPMDQAARHPHYPTLSFLTAPMNLDPGKLDLPAFCRMMQSARDRYDYIFLDAPAGVGSGFHLVTSAADRFLVVTGAGPAAVRDATRVGELLELQGRHNVRMVVNRISKAMLSTLRMTVDDVMDTAGLPLIGVVLEDPNVVLAAACGQPVLRFSPRTTAARSFQKIAKRIQGFPEPITLR